MIHLDDVYVLEAKLGAAAATTNPDVLAFFIDDASGTPIADKAAVTLSGTANTTVVNHGASGKKRAITTVALQNKDTAAVTVTIQVYDGVSVRYPLFVATLQTGDNLGYDDRRGWYVTDSSGQLRTSGSTSGRIIRTIQYLTSGTAATYTPPTLCWGYEIEEVGGGGGGGGAASTAANCAAGSGGCAGSYLRAFIIVVSGTATYTVGALGAGGTAGNNNGTGGGNTTFAYNGTTYTAPGGGGGSGSAAGNVSNIVIPAATTGSTNGDINGRGMAGEPGITMSGTIGGSGSGGSGPFGGGGVGLIAEAAGNAGAGYGAGGGGALSLGTSTRAGGDGTGGLIKITEYY